MISQSRNVASYIKAFEKWLAAHRKATILHAAMLEKKMKLNVRQVAEADRITSKLVIDSG